MLKRKNKKKQRKQIFKPLKLVVFLVIGFWAGITLNASKNLLFVHPKNIEVRFSPKGGCADLIVSAINNAKRRILVQAYCFTSQSLAFTLIQAKKRGVQVKMIVDKSQKTFRHSKIKYLIKNDILVNIENSNGLSHNKIFIIDDEVVITGSYNFTQAAEKKNSENLLKIKNKKFAKIYIDNWNNIYIKSIPLKYKITKCN